MDNYSEQSAERLREIQAELERQYAGYQARNLKLDMSRGKPSGSQLDLTNGILDRLDGYMVEGGIDARNYGCLEGIHEARKLFSELLGIPRDRLMIGGNSSLNMMYDTIVRHWVFGTHGHTPWGRLPAVKFLCPCPGYDRHFAICEDLGIEMIPIPMTESGPDMDLVEKIAGSDEAVKGIWCVPLYSNPQGVCYSDETVDRLASMRTAAPDFRIYWDNAYMVHYVSEQVHLLNLYNTAKSYGNEDIVYAFGSTSKITFGGAGVAFMIASEKNLKSLNKLMSLQTIGPNKINQLAHVLFFKNKEGVMAQMAKHAELMKPKFEAVLSTLSTYLTGIARWIEPKGGYFVSVDLAKGTAKRTVELAKEMGVVFTAAGATYPYHKDPDDSNVRIAPSLPPVEDLKTAMKVFCVAAKLAYCEKYLAK